MKNCEQRYDTPDLPRDQRPIRLGSLLFTMVEPRPGYEVAYNRWYERDHFYSGCMIGEWTLAGNRFVATREDKGKRIGNGSRPVEQGSYLALYWILDGHHADWDRWAVRQVKDLHAQGRMFQERDHIHTGFYRFNEEYNAPGSTMPIELALDRPYGGVAAFLVDLAPGKSKADVAAWLRAQECPGDVAMMGSPMPLDPTRPADVPASEGNHVLFLSFTVEAPQTIWEDRYLPFAHALDSAGLGSVSFASPFRATVFGTDTYTDQLE
ncbi:hypothetical protein [Caenibius sp. WL]|uniref:hypothetical protein n=1 Tax=Caenibius sp. WL TaxID=2872646 RepID=UPI001C996E66|nr:hypothetical protein [Caenibius sp. WL]QZP09071.1 hypothetical protein K5X80_04660 [Caenibius sp. WL]